MGAVRWEIDPKATTPLRFDDDEFLDALRFDADKDTKALALLLDVEDASAYDFSSMIADGVVIHARECITGPEADHLQVAMQLAERKGTRYNAGDYNKEWWATWVTGIEDAVGDIPESLLKGLCSVDKAKRMEAICSRKLPQRVRAMLFTRLRAHEDAAKAPAMRDPKLSPTVDETD